MQTMLALAYLGNKVQSLYMPSLIGLPWHLLPSSEEPTVYFKRTSLNHRATIASCHPTSRKENENKEQYFQFCRTCILTIYSSECGCWVMHVTCTVQLFIELICTISNNLRKILSIISSRLLFFRDTSPT